MLSTMEKLAVHLGNTLVIQNKQPGFPVAEHFNTNAHSLHDAEVRGLKLCPGNENRKRQEMSLIFQLGTSQSRTLNIDFWFL